MLNLLRVLFLLLSLSAVGMAWVLHARPAWIGQFDQWMTDRHLSGPQAFQAEVADGTWSGPELIERLEDQLEDLAPVQLGDRRFSIWKSLVETLVREFRASAQFQQALRWQRVLVAEDPADLEAQLLLYQLLLESNDPEQTQEARQGLLTLHRKIPEWKGPVEALLELARRHSDGALISKIMPAWSRAHTDQLTRGWQFFAWLEGQKQPIRTARWNAEWQPEHQVHQLSWSLPDQGRVERLRVDPPPKADGQLVNFRWTVTGASPEPAAVPIARIEEAFQPTGSTTIYLSGKSDPRLTSQPIDREVRATRISFEARIGLPVWIHDFADQHPDWKSRWETEAWWSERQTEETD